MSALGSAFGAVPVIGNLLVCVAFVFSVIFALYGRGEKREFWLVMVLLWAGFLLADHA